MNIEEFDRLNKLSEKLLTHSAASIEKEEFYLLLSQWNNSKYNLLREITEFNHDEDAIY